MYKTIYTALLSLCVYSGALGAAEYGHWQVGASSDDNVNRAGWASDQRSDTILDLNYLRGNYTAADKGSGYSLAYHTGYQHYLDYGGMSHLGLGGTAAYRHKFGLGRNAWWWRGSADAAYRLYGDGDRSNLQLKAGLDLGKRFIDRISTQLSYHYLTEDASAAVFDRSGTELGWRVSYGITSDWSVYAGGSQYQGDTTVVDSWAPSAAVKVTGVDNIFGMNTYLIDVSTSTSHYGISYAVDEASSFDLSSEHWSAQGAQDPSYWYYKNIVKLSFTRVF